MAKPAETTGAPRVLPDPQQKYLTSAEVALILRMSEDRLGRLRKLGGGPPFTSVGRTKGSIVLYPRKAFEQWCERLDAGAAALPHPGRPGKTAPAAQVAA